MGVATQDPDCLSYEPFFGLREKPFSLSPDPRFFYRTASHEAAFRDLLAGIRRREGMLALTGEVGTGKTTLCRTVLESLDRKTFAAFVPDPILSREDLLKTLLVEFGVVSVDEIRGGHLRGASRLELSYPLYEFVMSLQPLNAFAVVIIDEAQNLPAPLLEEIRILSDLENRQKLLQLLLVGQPELQSRLSQPDMRQLTQRLSVRCELAPLSPLDVSSYTAYRLAVAGATTTCFDDEAVDLVVATSGGIPRIINLLCDRAMFRAAQSQSRTVACEHVMGAADDLKMPRPEPVFHSEDSASTSVVKTVSDATARRASRQGLPATYQMRHDAHYVEELVSSRPFAGDLRTDGDSAESAPIQERDLFGDETAARRTRTLRRVAAAVFVLLGIAGVWSWRSAPVTTNVGRDRSPANVQETSRMPAAQVAEPVPPIDPASSPASSPEERYIIQMATFQGAARAAESVQEFEAAGYMAFSVEVPLVDGSGHAVFLGPYSGRPEAEQALRNAAGRVPGYKSGRIVQTGTRQR